MNGQFFNYFAELINRFRSKSPKFFQILQIFMASFTFLGYLPSMLQRWFGIEVPGPMITMCEDIAKYATGIFIASLLPVNKPAVGQTKEGSEISVTDEKKMPFTAAVEAKKEPEPPVIPGVPDEPKN